MKDNFDLKKFLVENKTIEKYNPFTTEKEKETLSEGASHLYPNGQRTSGGVMEELRGKIREMIISELSEENMKEDIDEAKKDEKETEEVETEETEETTEEETEETTEEEPAAEEGGGDLEGIAADMEGTEGEVMDHLMSALKVAKGMNNEKLTTQIGNTLKFFVSEYIGGEEEK